MYLAWSGEINAAEIQPMSQNAISKEPRSAILPVNWRKNEVFKAGWGGAAKIKYFLRQGCLVCVYYLNSVASVAGSTFGFLAGFYQYFPLPIAQ